ncbi:MAG: hypothetical protein FJW56_09255 [Actinobacteria bacterium]|nr:hypothetical protein [Actinomycetota bacterium]
MAISAKAKAAHHLMTVVLILSSVVFFKRYGIALATLSGYALASQIFLIYFNRKTFVSNI